MSGDVVKIPSCGIPRQVTPREIYDVAEPSDRQVWSVCPYLRDQERCKGCPAWEEFEHHGRCKRGCRAMAEEACRVVMAALPAPPKEG